MAPRTLPAVAATAVSLLLAFPATADAVEGPGSDVLDPDGAAALAEKATPDALALAVGLPADLADTPGDLIHFSAYVRDNLSEINFIVTVDTTVALAAAGVERTMTEEGWTINGGLTDGPGFTASRDVDGVEDDNLDGIGEQQLTVRVEEQPDGETSISYTVSDRVDPSTSLVADSALFAGITEANVDPALTFDSASLTATLEEFSRSGGFGTSTTPPGVAFTGRYTAPISEAERLVGLLGEVCERSGYSCTDEPYVIAPNHGNVFLRLPSGGEGTLTVSPLPEDGIAVVQFFLSFNLDTGFTIDPAEDTALPLPTPSDDVGDEESSTVPPKGGAEPRQDQPVVALDKGAVSTTPNAQVLAVAAMAAVAAVGLGLRAALRRRRRPEPPAVDAVPDNSAPLDDDPFRALAVAALGDRSAARTRVVQLEGHRLEVLLSAPVAAPEGWLATADTVVGRSGINRVDPSPVAPLLTSLGNDGAVELWFDLEAERCVELLGDVDRAKEFLASMLLGFDSADVDVRAVADDVELQLLADDITPSETWRRVIDALEETALLLEQRGWPSAFAGRALAPDERVLRPIVVVTDQPIPTDALAWIDHPAAGVLTVLTFQPAGGTPMVFTDNTIELPTLGITTVVDPHRAEPEIDLRPVAVVPTRTPRRRPVTHAPVVVRLLGDIRIEGGKPLTARQVSVLAYIATHPAATVARVVDSVWSASTMANRKKTLANTVSEIRTAIGKEQLPDAVGGRYRVGPGVVTDIDLFDALVSQADHGEPLDRADSLRAALELVEGPPFTYPAGAADSYSWVDVENQVATWEGRIRDVTRRCVEHYLDAGEPAEAAQVATSMLAALPTDATITGLLLRSHAANGDQSSVRAVFAAYQRSLQTLDLDAVDPALAAIYEDLLAGADA